MQTIVEIATGQSVFLFDDDVAISMSGNSISVGNPIEMSIVDMNASTAILVQNVTAPDDWIGRKYLYQDGKWELNPNWSPFVPSEPE